MIDERNPEAVRVELVGWRTPRSGRFARVSGEARELQQEAGERVLQRWLKTAQDESPEGERYENVGKHRRQERRGPRLKASWRTRLSPTRTGAEGELRNIAAHAPFVFSRTKAHPIKPRGPWQLAWQRPAGIFHFAPRGVMHPGTKANDVPGRVLESVRAFSRGELNKVARQVRMSLVDVFRT